MRAIALMATLIVAPFIVADPTPIPQREEVPWVERATPMALVDSTSSYFAQMGAVPLLTAAGELALARLIEDGDGGG